jgi:hypothetical protein
VIVETHIEFGTRSIVVPYDKDYVYPGKHPDYHGASPVAMAKLANKKGYRLVGSNEIGFNTIYIRRGLVEGALPEVSPETVLDTLATWSVPSCSIQFATGNTSKSSIISVFQNDASLSAGATLGLVG